MKNAKQKIILLTSIIVSLNLHANEIGNEQTGDSQQDSSSQVNEAQIYNCSPIPECEGDNSTISNLLKVLFEYKLMENNDGKPLSQDIDDTPNKTSKDE